MTNPLRLASLLAALLFAPLIAAGRGYQDEAIPGTQLEALQQNLTEAFGDRFAFVDGAVAVDRAGRRFWMASIRAQSEGEFALRCEIAYEYPPGVKAPVPLPLTATLTYHLVIAKAGTSRVHYVGNYDTWIYPLACVGDTLVVPIPCQPRDTRHRFSLPDKPGTDDKVNFQALQEVRRYGQPEPGQKEIEIRNGARDVLALVASKCMSSVSRDLRTMHYALEALFDTKEAGKFNLDIDLKGKVAEKTSGPIKLAFEVMPKDQPLTVLVCRWQVREDHAAGSTSRTEQVALGVHPLRVADRLGLFCGEDWRPARDGAAKLPVVDILRRPFEAPVEPFAQGPKVK